MVFLDAEYDERAAEIGVAEWLDLDLGEVLTEDDEDDEAIAANERGVRHQRRDAFGFGL